MQLFLYGKTGEPNCISPLTLKMTWRANENSIQDYLLESNNHLFFKEFRVLPHGNEKYLPQLKESILIKRDKPILNKNIISALLHLLNKV